MPPCKYCGRTDFPSLQSLRAHLRFCPDRKVARKRRDSVPPPTPRAEIEEKPAEPLYKQYPTQPWQPMPAYAQSAQQPYPQPLQQQPQAVPQPQPPQLVEKAKAPVKAEEVKKSSKEQIRELFEKHHEELKKTDERLRPLKEGFTKLGERTEKFIKKAERGEFPWQKPEDPPAAPPLDPWQVKKIIEGKVTEAVANAFEAKAGEDRCREGNAEHEKAEHETETREGEKPKPPEEPQKEAPQEPPRESPPRIFPLLRRPRRFLR